MLRAILAAPSTPTEEKGALIHHQITTAPHITHPLPSSRTFHPLPWLPIEIQLLILEQALSKAMAGMYVTRYFRCQYTGDWTQARNRCSVEEIMGMMRPEELGYVEGKFKTQFKARRREVMRHGLGDFLGVSRAWRYEVLKFLEKRHIRGTCWESVMRDRRRKVLKRWKDAVYLFDIGEGREMEAEEERRRESCVRNSRLVGEIKREAYCLSLR